MGRVWLRNGGDACVHVVIGHASSVSPYMASRLLRNRIRIRQREIAAPAGLTQIFTVVVYPGRVLDRAPFDPLHDGRLSAAAEPAARLRLLASRHWPYADGSAGPASRVQGRRSDVQACVPGSGCAGRRDTDRGVAARRNDVGKADSPVCSRSVQHLPRQSGIGAKSERGSARGRTRRILVQPGPRFAPEPATEASVRMRAA